MIEWYYARGGQQGGPVTFVQLGELARSGALDPVNDLVWTATMTGWTPAGQVPGLFNGVNAGEAPAAPAAPATPVADPSNPYAAPQSAWIEPVSSPGTGLTQIIPGSEPIDIGACVKRGFELTKRQFGIIVLVGLVYFAIFMGIGLIQGLLDVAMRVGTHGSNVQSSELSGGTLVVFAISRIITQVVSIFIGLGLTRVGLNLVSGKQVAVGMLFGEGSKLLRAIGASILFGLMVLIGCLLLIVPGIYLALRYGQFMNAIVDRDLGIMDAFSYSSSITTNNRLPLFGLGLVCGLIVIAGMLACGIGLIFAGPVAWLSSMVAYRWMQYGARATMDHPGTQTPLLSGQ